jgi:hypothetical protein
MSFPNGPKTLLCYLMSRMEGYGIVGAIPTVRNNPLDLRHCPNCNHLPDAPNDIGYIDNIQEGWIDAERQLQLYANESFTLEDMVKVFLGIPASEDISGPNPDHNNGVIYLSYLCDGLHMQPSNWTSTALEILYSPLTTSQGKLWLESFIQERKLIYDKVKK